MAPRPFDLAKQAAAVPPNPPTEGPEGPYLCGDIDIRIGRDGTWFYHGSPIGRKPLVKLFASVLRRDDDGEYWLVTPVERARIAVDDAPFVAVAMTSVGAGRGVNVDNTIEGAGHIQGAGFVNHGTIDANATNAIELTFDA